MLQILGLLSPELTLVFLYIEKRILSGLGACIRHIFRTPTWKSLALKNVVVSMKPLCGFIFLTGASWSKGVDPQNNPYIQSYYGTYIHSPVPPWAPVGLVLKGLTKEQVRSQCVTLGPIWDLFFN